jgi:hypothetical protein
MKLLVVGVGWGGEAVDAGLLMYGEKKKYCLDEHGAAVCMLKFVENRETCFMQSWFWRWWMHFIPTALLDHRNLSIRTFVGNLTLHPLHFLRCASFTKHQVSRHHLIKASS